MAKVKSNNIMEGLSGKLGKQLVIRHMRDGRTIVLTRPDFSNRVFSEGQLTHQSRFQLATAYARTASKTNPVYAQFAAGTPKSAYNLALSDWFHPPIIHSIQRQNDCILVDVTDNVLVAQVIVKILNEQGETLEQGQAVAGNGTCWEYTTAAQGKVVIEARDLAGNVTRQEYCPPSQPFPFEEKPVRARNE
jgi:hypothetical protein